MTGATGAAQDDPARVGPSTTAGGDAATATPSLAEVQGRRIKKSSHIDVWKTVRVVTDDGGSDCNVSFWHWHFRAGNGQIVGQSPPRGYRRIRDVVRSIELTMGGEVIEGVTTWYLTRWVEADRWANVPIRVPEGVSLASRRRP